MSALLPAQNRINNEPRRSPRRGFSYPKSNSDNTIQENQPKGKPHMTMLTTAQVEVRYGIGRTTLYRYIRDGKITARRVGPRMLRYCAEQLDDLFGGPLLSDDKTT